MKRVFTNWFALVLALSLVLLPADVVQAADPYEYYNLGSDNSVYVYSTYWAAQTFTATSDHSVTSVKLKLIRGQTLPGTVTVSIRATDGSGQPTGSDLTSGTTDGDTLIYSSPGEWREIPLTSYDLTKDIKYAIVVRGPPGGNLSNWFRWFYDGSAPTYDDGNLEDSADGGTTWTTHTDKDYMFEVWGESPVEVGGTVYPVNKLSVLAPWLVLVAALIVGTSIAVRRRRAQS